MARCSGKKRIQIIEPLPNLGLGGAVAGIIADLQLWPAKTSRPASAYLSGPSKLPGHTFFQGFEPEKLPCHTYFFCLTFLACYNFLALVQPSNMFDYVSLKGFEIVTWYVLAMLESFKPGKTSNSSSLRGCLGMYLWGMSKLLRGMFYPALKRLKTQKVWNQPACVSTSLRVSMVVLLQPPNWIYFWFIIWYNPCLTSPHRFGPPSCLIIFLFPHVSGLLRPPCFTPVFLSFILKQFRSCYVACFSQARKASKPEKNPNTSDLPRCLCILEGIQIARWHALVRLESLKNPKISISQHAPASVDNRPASATNWGKLGLYSAQPFPHLLALALKETRECICTAYWNCKAFWWLKHETGGKR